MSRWIDIDDISLLKTVSAGGLSAKALWKLIRQQPSIDLVFCGECKRKRLCDSVGSVDDWNYCYWGERKETEPTISKMEQVDKDTNVRSKDCETCKWGDWYRNGYDITTMDDECGGCCSWNSKWTPKTEPQVIACPIQEEDADYARWLYEGEPQTDCKVCLYRNIPKNSPHCMSCKNNSKFERDWSAEPQTERSSE